MHHHIAYAKNCDSLPNHHHRTHTVSHNQTAIQAMCPNSSIQNLVLKSPTGPHLKPRTMGLSTLRRTIIRTLSATKLQLPLLPLFQSPQVAPSNYNGVLGPKRTTAPSLTTSRVATGPAVASTKRSSNSTKLTRLGCCANRLLQAKQDIGRRTSSEIRTTAGL